MSNTQPKGLGGWLILLAIGLIFTPVRLVYEYLPLYQELFDQGFWEIFTTPSSEYYHPLWAPFIICEIVANSFIVLACIFLIFAFFAKSRIFPKGYIFIMLFSMVLIPLDAWLATILIPEEPMWDPNTLKEFIRTIISSAIWLPYLIVSKRVKATFK